MTTWTAGVEKGRDSFVRRLAPGKRAARILRPVPGGVADVVKVPMGEDGVVDLLLRIDAMQVAADPVAAEAFGRRQQDHAKLQLGRTVELADVVEDGRAVRQPVEHVLAAPRIDEVKVHHAGPPGRQCLLPVGNADATLPAQRRQKRRLPGTLFAMSPDACSCLSYCLLRCE